MSAVAAIWGPTGNDVGDHARTRLEEVRTKLDRVRDGLERADLDAVLLGSQSDFAWITAGGRSHISIGDARGVASVLVSRDHAWVVSNNIEIVRMFQEEVPPELFEAVSYAWHRPADERDAVAELCDPARSVSDLGAAGLPSGDAGVTELRRVLLPSERDRYRALGRDVALAVEHAARAARPGDTELDVAGRIAEGGSRRDILPLVNLVAADDRIGRYRHTAADGEPHRPHTARRPHGTPARPARLAHTHGVLRPSRRGARDQTRCRHFRGRLDDRGQRAWHVAR